MLLHARSIVQARSTLDIDLLGQLDNSSQSITNAVKTIILQPVGDDGLVFDPKTIILSAISEDATYTGRRVNFRANLGSMVIPMQLDVGFGDRVVPEASLIDTPTLLDYPAGKMFGYAIETSVAEKVHTMLQLELLNSRMKDFYDVWLLIKEKQIDQHLLTEAIVSTFTARNLTINMNSMIFSDTFIQHPDKHVQWAAFCRKKGIKNTPIEFSQVASDVLSFLEPILRTAKGKERGDT